ncbi:hypothetical protein [Paenibacillus chitinolyticus]
MFIPPHSDLITIAAVEKMRGCGVPLPTGARHFPYGSSEGV